MQRRWDYRHEEIREFKFDFDTGMSFSELFEFIRSDIALNVRILEDTLGKTKPIDAELSFVYGSTGILPSAIPQTSRKRLKKYFKVFERCLKICLYHQSDIDAYASSSDGSTDDTEPWKVGSNTSLGVAAKRKKAQAKKTKLKNNGNSPNNTFLRKETIDDIIKKKFIEKGVELESANIEAAKTSIIHRQIVDGILNNARLKSSQAGLMLTNRRGSLVHPGFLYENPENLGVSMINLDEETQAKLQESVQKSQTRRKSMITEVANQNRLQNESTSWPETDQHLESSQKSTQPSSKLTPLQLDKSL
jgi:hypothetical protein